MIDLLVLFVIHLACLLFWFWLVLVLAVLVPLPALVALWVAMSAVGAWYVKGLK